jgi:tetratricopeptide (TPR) repeat protein
MKFRKEKAKQPPSQPQGMTIGQAINAAYAHWKVGQPQQAEQICQQVLAAWPEHPDALHVLGLIAHGFGNRDSALGYMRRACAAPRAPALFHSNLAEMLRQSGLLIEAEEEGRRAVALDGQSTEAWGNLGIILQEAGKLAESLQCLIRVCQIAPDRPEAHNNLGNTYKRLGRLNEAKGEYEAAIRLNPSYPEVHSNLANLLNDLGQHDEAMAMARRAIELNPRNADAYLNAAAIAIARRQPDEAAHWIGNILSFAPEHPGALLNLAIAQRETEDLRTAEQTARRAVAAAPQSAECHEILGQVLQAMNRPDEAQAEYERAAKLPMPNPERPVERRARLLLERGRAREALAAFDEALAINPRSAEVWFNRCEAKTFTADDPDIAAMERLLTDGQRQGIGLDDRICLLFALGKACLDSGEDDRAFAFLNEGNRLKRSTFAYDADAVDRWLDGIARTVSPEQLSRLAGHGDPSELPVFVVGMPGSGTAPVERILTAHPQVYGAGERRLLQNMMERISGTDHVPLGYPRLIESTAPEDLSRLARHYLDRVAVPMPDKLRILDKMPGNVLYAGFIHVLFPNARIIHCRRDPADACLSCYVRLFSGGQTFAYDLAELGRFYKGYERLTDYWKSVLPADRYTEVRYEDAVGDPETEARRLIGFCGLEWDDACLSSLDPEPPERSGIGRGKTYARHLGPLLSALGSDETAWTRS